MICLLHGYLLEGSGSNLWTRSVVQALCRTGQTVHLVCQENHPDSYDFISHAYLYHADGTVTTLLSRDIPYTGRCIMHKPQLGDTLPVYVWDKYEEFPNVVPMVDLPDDEIESYIERNVDVVLKVVRDNGITVMQANHMVLMSVVAQRVSKQLGTPYYIMPHGSALEYAVKADQRFQKYARESVAHARGILVSSPELGERVVNVLPELPQTVSMIREVRVGVDTGGFTPIARDERPGNIARLVGILAQTPETDDPNAKLPDPLAGQRLPKIDWMEDDIILYVGRLIEEKGVQHVVEAFPRVLQTHPRARLIIAGHGPLRESLEEMAAQSGVADRVTFVGYFTHRELRWLFPCCDVGVFPSLVKESGPMVFLEALSSGCFPIATYFAGAKNKIDTVAPHLDPADVDYMKVRPDPQYLTDDLVSSIAGALSVCRRYPQVLRRIAEDEYDWKPIASNLARQLLS